MKKQAVVVGVNEYQDAAVLRPLKGAEQDATEIRDILTKHGDFVVQDNHFLVGRKATHQAVRAAISDLLWKTDESDLTLFYFSGHGVADSYGSCYLAPWDMIGAQPLVHGIEMQGLRELALKSPNKDSVVLILDCCYAGVAADANAKQGPIEAVKAAENCFSGMGSDETTEEVAEGVFVLSSSAADQLSRERLDCQHKLGNEETHHHGAFSFHLIEGLSGLAAGDGDVVSVKTLREYVDLQGGGNPAQTFKLFSSRETNAGRIILTRATDVVQLSASLANVKTNLGAGDYVSLIIAADTLCGVLSNRPNYEAAKDLRRQLDEALVPCRQQSMRWLQKYKVALMQQARSVCGRLEKFVTVLSVNEIELQRKETDSLLGLVLTLVQAVEEGWDVEKLLPYLHASETPAQPSPSQPKTGSRGVR